MKKLFWSSVYFAYAVYRGIRAMSRTQLGSRVKYRGEVWTIYNWADGPYSLSIDRDGVRECVKYVPAVVCVPLLTPRELVHRFRVIYRWWMTSWHSIYVNRRMHPEWERW